MVCFHCLIRVKIHLNKEIHLYSRILHFKENGKKDFPLKQRYIWSLRHHKTQRSTKTNCYCAAATVHPGTLKSFNTPKQAHFRGRWHIYIYTNICIYIYIYMSHMFTYIYIYIYIYVCMQPLPHLPRPRGPWCFCAFGDDQSRIYNFGSPKIDNLEPGVLQHVPMIPFPNRILLQLELEF